MEIDTLFQCPVCGSVLRQGEAQYHCQHGHTFDIARQGYVNLLLPHLKGIGGPGDSREMLQSRREFLRKEYYAPFADRLNDLILADLAHIESRNRIGILDAGCGEGYYTWRLYQRTAALAQAARIDMYGIDVAKSAIASASHRQGGIRFAIASTHHLPFLNESMHEILCLFAPRDEAEFHRVLRPEGTLFVAAPGPRHLYGLRIALYQHPEPIGSKGDVQQGFQLIESVNVNYEMHVSDTADILHLLTMTPYVRHTDEEAIVRVRQLTELHTAVDINILVYRKV